LGEANLDQANSAFGSVLGAFIGDAIGAYLEFAGYISNEMLEEAFLLQGGGRLDVGPGQITDDSEMAMCLLHSLTSQEKENMKTLKVGIKSILDLNEVQKYFGMWYKSDPFDIGFTTRSALQVIDLEKLDPKASFMQTQKYTYGSESNGCLMRITP
jgi:ADP-ribosyl-[dinitrogen reductase] hydrolase